MKVITVKLDEKMLQEMDVLAIKNEMTRSDFIREAIKRYIRELKNKPREPKFKVKHVRL